MTHLSRFFKKQRLAKKISFGELARHCGYINVSRGANRIATFERLGKIHPDLFRKLAPRYQRKGNGS